MGLPLVQKGESEPFVPFGFLRFSFSQGMIFNHPNFPMPKSRNRLTYSKKIKEKEGKK
jgi:hypothetical protein